MTTCIHCGKIGSILCNDCIRKGKMQFLFPLNKRDIATINEVNKPKVENKAEHTVLIKEEPKVEAIVEQRIVGKNEDVVTSHPTANDTTVVPVMEENQKNLIVVVDSMINKSNNESTPVSTNESNKNTLHGDSNFLDDDDEYSNDDTHSSGKGWGWWIVVGVIVGIVVASILLPWSIGQWIVGISIGFIVFVGFLLLASVADFDDDFVVLDTILFILSGMNIGLKLWIKSGYSTIAFVIAIALAMSSFIVMGRAYFEAEAKQGHWALFFMLINIASIFMDRIVVYVTQLFSNLI